MWAAIRYRRAQAVVLVLLATLVATCAVFAPLYQRALEQSLLRSSISSASVADTALVVRSGRGTANPTFRSGALSGNVPGPVWRLYGGPIGQMNDSINIVPRAGLKPSPGDLVARDRVCEHLKITTGACPKSEGEILVSAKDLAAWKWQLGTKLHHAGAGHRPDRHAHRDADRSSGPTRSSRTRRTGGAHSWTASRARRSTSGPSRCRRSTTSSP